MAKISLGLLAERLGLTLTKGNPDRKVARLAGLEEAGPGDLSFLANPAYAKLLAATGAEAAVVGRDVGDAPCALLQADNPDLAFARAAVLISPPPPLPPPGVHSSALVAPSARLGRDVSIGAGTVIEDGAVVGDRTIVFPQAYVGTGTHVGEECLLYPGVKIYHGVTIGSRCIVHAGTVIGSDGFGYAWTGQGYFKIPQVGTVVIEDDVEIGANVCVDRARFGETRIGRGTKLDNLVQIAHNVRLGPCCAFAAQVGIAGSASVGAGVQMGGQAAAVGHIRIGDGLTIVGQSAVSKSIPGREAGVGKDRLIWIDSPAKPMREHLREAQNLKALGRLRETVRNLEARVRDLENGGRREAPAENEEG
ncbi:MAG: UDP-3-O-(3-hydroxymyristoyl)glucosamine N-acyltransferase [Planctomycetota bacterium]|jgi:UDP-3-O-[3-hydroxymyristoyl] glucosamine N-acyltransferase|nr:UDP-3-O-(3-hydroxymyristoyl)glucosamine N-acyltransferase [Planctomycetota bacterium]